MIKELEKIIEELEKYIMFSYYCLIFFFLSLVGIGIYGLIKGL